MRFDTEQDLTNHKATHFGYTSIKPDILAREGGTEQTLVTIVVDKSGSTSGFTSLMDTALNRLIQGCAKCPRADYLLLRVLVFDSSQKEIHGFIPLRGCVNDVGKVDTMYDGVLRASGMTALYDVTVDAIEAEADYGKQLVAQDYDVNGIVIVMTDGMDVCSTYGIPEVSAALNQVMKSESMESFVSILAAINPQGDAEALRKFNEDGGFSQYVEITDVTEETIGKLVDWVSESISSQSQSLGSGVASVPLSTPTF